MTSRPRNPRAFARPSPVTDAVDDPYVLVATMTMPHASCETMAWALAWARTHGVPAVMLVGSHDDDKTAFAEALYINAKKKEDD